MMMKFGYSQGLKGGANEEGAARREPPAEHCSGAPWGIVVYASRSIMISCFENGRAPHNLKFEV